MDREQIIKALECCTETHTCEDCAYDNKQWCVNTNMSNALSLINELTEENKSLKHTISQLGKNNDELARVLPLAKKEVEGETRADTVRKMRDRLKRRFKGDKDGIYSIYNIHRFIYQIAKEMLEENENGKR